MPLSNPTSKAEAHPQNLYEWTNGEALVATGSPFGTVKYNQKEIRIPQCNNALIFPGIGLGIIISKAKKVTDNMLWAASKALSKISSAMPEDTGETMSILPDFDNIIEISSKIAIEVAKQAAKDDVGIESGQNSDFYSKIAATTWQPKYYPYTSRGN